MDPTFCDPNHILQSSIENCKNEEEDMDMEQYEFPKDEIEEQEIEFSEESFEDEFMRLQHQDYKPVAGVKAAEMNRQLELNGIVEHKN